MVLVTVGLVMVYSASSASAVLDRRNPLALVTKQAIAASLGVALYLALSRMRPKAIRRLGTPLLLASLVSMMVVLVPGIGIKANGARRWIDLGITQFQPSELAKLALVLWIADVCARRGRGRVEIAVPLVVTGLMALLVIAEPDLGTTLVISLTAITMLFVAGASAKHIVRLLAGGACAVAILIATVPYMQSRLLAFIDPWSKAEGAGFQTVHSIMAIGSGGWFGVGPGNGILKISYLPEAHTDMIAATIGEEFGIVGFGAIIVLFTLYVFAGYRVAITATTTGERLIATGLTTVVGVQAGINLGAVLGLLPITGIPLPFISYGGTSLVVFLAVSGILVNIGRSASSPAGGRSGVRDTASASGDRGRGDSRARHASPGGGRRATPAWR